MDPKKKHVIVTECSLSPSESREKTAEIMFERFNVAALSIVNRDVMSLFQSGRTTGVVIHIGAENSVVVPIQDGCVLAEAVTKLPFSGQDITSYLSTLLAEKGHEFVTHREKELVDDIKKEHCYVAQHFESELLLEQANPCNFESIWELPHGWAVTIGRERFKCAEILFTPELMEQVCGGDTNVDTIGVHVATIQAINKCDSNIRGQLFQNIVLSGGTCKLPGFASRLKSEIIALLSDMQATDDVKVALHHPVGHSSAWTGAAILSSLPEFKDFWITKEQYDDQGPAVMHKIQV